MDRLTGSAAFAALFLSAALSGCGGGSTSATTAAAAGGASGPTATVQGVSTPSTISVVTPKNTP